MIREDSDIYMRAYALLEWRADVCVCVCMCVATELCHLISLFTPLSSGLLNSASAVAEIRESKQWSSVELRFNQCDFIMLITLVTTLSRKFYHQNALENKDFVRWFHKALEDPLD